MPRIRRLPAPPSTVAAVPFLDAEEAWLWAMHGLVARDDGARPVAGLALYPRPCEPDDLVRTVDRLHRFGRISSHHVRILSDYGRRLMPPDINAPEEELDARLWDEALDLMTTPLRHKEIVL